MKSIVVTSSAYIDFGLENNDKDPKFEDGDHVSLVSLEDGDHSNIFAECYAPKGSEEAFVIKKVKILYHGYM